MITAQDLQAKYEVVLPLLDERQRRVVAAADAISLGRGGISMVAGASGLSRTTIHRGIAELEEGVAGQGRVRAAGGGRKAIWEHDPSLLVELEELVECWEKSRYGSGIRSLPAELAPPATSIPDPVSQVTKCVRGFMSRFRVNFRSAKYPCSISGDTSSTIGSMPCRNHHSGTDSASCRLLCNAGVQKVALDAPWSFSNWTVLRNLGRGNTYFDEGSRCPQSDHALKLKFIL